MTGVLHGMAPQQKRASYISLKHHAFLLGRHPVQVDRAIKMCRRCMLHMSTGWYTLCSTDKPLGPHQTPANGASTSLATSFVNGEKMKKKRRHTAADKAANNERGETAKWKKVEERRSQGTLPGW